MRKRLVEIIVLASFLAIFTVTNRNVQEVTHTVKRTYYIEQTELPEVYKTLAHQDYLEQYEEIRNEITYGEIELLAQLIRAEAGNQDETGKRYVADVVLNRVADKDFPDKIEDVIFQRNPVQFSCTVDGNFDEASWTMTEEDYRVALEEYTGERLNKDVLYFRTGRYSDSGTPAFKYGDHYFSTE